MTSTPKNTYAEACASALARDVLPQIAHYVKNNTDEMGTLDIDALITKFQQVLELPATRPAPSVPRANGTSHIPSMIPPPTIPFMGGLTPALSGGAIPNGIGALPTATTGRGVRSGAKAVPLDQWSDPHEAKRRLYEGGERICSYMAPRDPNKGKVCCVACPTTTQTDASKIRCKAHEKSCGKFEKFLAESGGSSVTGAVPTALPGFNAPAVGSNGWTPPMPPGVPKMMDTSSQPAAATSTIVITAKALDGMNQEHVCLTGVDSELAQWVIDAVASGDEQLVVIGKFSFPITDDTKLAQGYESSIVALSEKDISRLPEVQAKYVPIAGSSVKLSPPKITVPILQSLGSSLPGIQVGPSVPLMTMLPTVSSIPNGVPVVPRVPGIATLC